MVSTATAFADMDPSPRVVLDLDPDEIGVRPHAFPNASVETDLTNVSVLLSNGAGTLTQGSTAGFTQWGTKYARLQFTTASSTVQGGVRNRAPVTPGAQYSFNARARLESGANQLMRVEVDWRNASDVQIGSTLTGPSATVGTSAWVQLNAPQASAPLGASHAYIRVVATTGGRVWAVGNVLAVDAWSDGPYVEAPADTITVWQISKWGEVPVRDAIRRSVSGGFVITDYEPPPGVPVTYRVQKFDPAGVPLGFVLNLTVQVDLPEGFVVVQDPLAPRNAVLVRAEQRFADSLTRSRATSVYQAGGRTFAMSGLYSAFQQIALRCITQTETDREMLATILQESMILVRSMPSTRLPGAFYASIATVPMIPFDAFAGGDTDVWDITGDQVTRPELDILAAVFSYDRFKAYLDTLHPPTPGTYDDAAAEWSTYLDAMRNPPPEA